MYLTSVCLLLLWQSVQISAYPSAGNLLQPRHRAVTSYGLTRVKTLSSSSSSSSSDIVAGQLMDNARHKYLLPVEVEGTYFDLEIDTGSSDTWIIQTDFDCFETFDRSSKTFIGPQPMETCNFGPTYTPGEGYESDPDLYGKTCYGQTEYTNRCVRGEFGWTSVTFAGVTAKHQLLGAPSNSSYPAQGCAKQSGILGLAFSNLTNAFNSTTGKKVPYSSIMQNVFKSGVTASNVFALALSRDDSNTGNGGIMTVGGIPSLTDPAVNVSSKVYTSAPVEYVASRSLSHRTFYAISVDAVVLGNQRLSPDLQVIIDSGAATFQVPTDAARSMNSYWSPPRDSNGLLECDAVLTQPVGVAIGGATYYIPSEDLIGQHDDGTCFSSISGSSGSELLIGDPFLKSVLAVFDWDNYVLSFYPRPYYES